MAHRRRGSSDQDERQKWDQRDDQYRGSEVGQRWGAGYERDHADYDAHAREHPRETLEATRWSPYGYGGAYGAERSGYETQDYGDEREPYEQNWGIAHERENLGYGYAAGSDRGLGRTLPTMSATAGAAGRSRGSSFGRFDKRWSPASDRESFEPARRVGFRGKGPKGFVRSDDRVREIVCERLEDDDSIDASGIEVSVNSGEVTLQGTVDDRQTKRMVEDLIESLPGVRDVHNQLRIASRQRSEAKAEDRDETRGR